MAECLFPPWEAETPASTRRPRPADMKANDVISVKNAFNGPRGRRTYMNYWWRCTPTKSADGLSWNLSLPYQTGEGQAKSFTFSIPIEAISKPPVEGYLVFQIMRDNKPHPKPWLGCPSVGPIPNFEKPSCLGIQYEWLADGAWFNVPIECKLVEGFESANVYLHLCPWFEALTIIQLLESTVSPTHEFTEKATLGPVRVLQLIVDRVPEPASWHPGPGPLDLEIGTAQSQLSTPVTGPDTSTPEEITLDASAPANNPRCDTCVYAGINEAVQAENEESFTIPGVWICKTCALLDRSGTSTAPDPSQVIWGASLPVLASSNWTLQSTWSAKALFYHHAIHQDALMTPVPIQEPLVEKIIAFCPILN